MMPHTWNRAFAAMVCAATCILPSRGAETTSPDPEGYLRNWILLAPIALPEGGAAGDLLLRDQLKDEARLKPSAGESVTVQGKSLTWRPVTASTNYVDFNVLLNAQHDRAAGYLVTYVECEADIPDVIMAVGSNDQGRIYFNGVDIYAWTEARPLMLDADKGKVTLKKGINVIVFKVINEQNSWQASMRLLDKSGQPLKGLKVRREP